MMRMFTDRTTMLVYCRNEEEEDPSNSLLTKVNPGKRSRVNLTQSNPNKGQYKTENNDTSTIRTTPDR